MIKQIIKQAFQYKKMIENPICLHSENVNFPWDRNLGNSEISQEFPNGNSQEGKFQSHMDGRKQEFPVEHPWVGVTQECSKNLKSSSS